MTKKAQNSYLVPGSILVSAILIAGALVYGNDNGGNVGSANQALPNNGGVDNVRHVTEDDHIRGNPDASIAIIEYSDFECPFCARLHPTLSRIVEENEDVKWVYRHFPLTSIHSRAQRAAVASECVAKLGGNEAFWEFTDSLFSDQRGLGDDLYERLAVQLGINADELSVCLKDKAVAGEVTTDLNEAVSAGGRGTPFSILVTSSGEMVPFSGALPYENINGLIGQARQN